MIVIKKLLEAGAEVAALGATCAYKDPHLSWDQYSTEEQIAKSMRVAGALAGKGGGHDKFMRHIITWWWFKMPRSWWSQFDTYHVGVVSAQSESTMNTLGRKILTRDDFTPETPGAMINAVNGLVLKYQNAKTADNLQALRESLPEGYLQGRQVILSYANLENIIRQRHDHRYARWHAFCDALLAQIDHPEWIVP